MPTKADCVRAVRAFRSKNGVDAPDENVIAAIHLMNAHGIDVNAALDQSSRTANDRGIDAWHFDTHKRELSIYQSKLSESKSLVARGLSDLENAAEWLESVIVNGQLDEVPSNNHCLFNLYTRLSSVRTDLQRLSLVLLSPIDHNEIEDLEEFSNCEAAIARSRLNQSIRQRESGRVQLAARGFDLDRSVPQGIKTYTVERIPQTRVELRKNAHLDLAYLRLWSLVQLYRERGDALFDKNVRLSLIGNKEARDRLVNPMESTLDAIAKKGLSPSIFAFYHIGITLAASASDLEGETLINLEAPSIINGCQTIAIANEYLRKLEKQSAIDAIERFKEIKVIAKVVVGTTNEELKEITNSNNRQNPIENWQLFSNEPVHVEVETALKDIGVFYERQKGRFDSVMKNAENARYYDKTNGTFVRVVDLAQMITLARGNIALAAKPSDVFANKEAHDSCFDKYVARNPRDIVFAWNLYRALKRGLNKYLDIPAHVNSSAPAIFKKPFIRAHVYRLGLLHYYQSPHRQNSRREFCLSLHKKANPRLVEEVQGVLYQKVVARIRQWYTEESKQLTVEIAKKRTDAFFTTLAGELGVDEDAACPFTERAIDWRAVANS